MIYLLLYRISQSHGDVYRPAVQAIIVYLEGYDFLSDSRHIKCIIVDLSMRYCHLL